MLDNGVCFPEEDTKHPHWERGAHDDTERSYGLQAPLCNHDNGTQPSAILSLC